MTAKPDEHTVTITVEWGNELVGCSMPKKDLEKILDGERMVVVESYSYEGGTHLAEWQFNHPSHGNLVVSYDGDGVGFDGPLIDAYLSSKDHDMFLIADFLKSRDTCSRR